MDNYKHSTEVTDSSLYIGEQPVEANEGYTGAYFEPKRARRGSCQDKVHKGAERLAATVSPEGKTGVKKLIISSFSPDEAKQIQHGCLTNLLMERPQGPMEYWLLTKLAGLLRHEPCGINNKCFHRCREQVNRLSPRIHFHVVGPRTINLSFKCIHILNLSIWSCFLIHPNQQRRRKPFFLIKQSFV